MKLRKIWRFSQKGVLNMPSLLKDVLGQCMAGLVISTMAHVAVNEGPCQPLTPKDWELRSKPELSTTNPAKLGIVGKSNCKTKHTTSRKHMQIHMLFRNAYYLSSMVYSNLGCLSWETSTLLLVSVLSKERQSNDKTSSIDHQNWIGLRTILKSYWISAWISDIFKNGGEDARQNTRDERCFFWTNDFCNQGIGEVSGNETNVGVEDVDDQENEHLSPTTHTHAHTHALFTSYSSLFHIHLIKVKTIVNWLHFGIICRLYGIVINSCIYTSPCLKIYLSFTRWLQAEAIQPTCKAENTKAKLNKGSQRSWGPAIPQMLAMNNEAQGSQSTESINDAWQRLTGLRTFPSSPILFGFSKWKISASCRRVPHPEENTNEATVTSKRRCIWMNTKRRACWKLSKCEAKKIPRLKPVSRQILALLLGWSEVHQWWGPTSIQSSLRRHVKTETFVSRLSKKFALVTQPSYTMNIMQHTNQANWKPEASVLKKYLSWDFQSTEFSFSIVNLKIENKPFKHLQTSLASTFPILSQWKNMENVGSLGTKAAQKHHERKNSYGWLTVASSAACSPCPWRFHRVSKSKACMACGIPLSPDHSAVGFRTKINDYAALCIHTSYNICNMHVQTHIQTYVYYIRSWRCTICTICSEKSYRTTGWFPFFNSF